MDGRTDGRTNGWTDRQTDRQNLSRGSEETKINLTHVPTEIRTWHIQNTSQKRYQLSHLLVILVLNSNNSIKEVIVIINLTY
jgi:hypothetical protein